MKLGVLLLCYHVLTQAGLIFWVSRCTISYLPDWSVVGNLNCVSYRGVGKYSCIRSLLLHSFWWMEVESYQDSVRSCTWVCWSSICKIVFAFCLLRPDVLWYLWASTAPILFACFDHATGAHSMAFISWEQCCCMAMNSEINIGL